MTEAQVLISNARAITAAKASYVNFRYSKLRNIVTSDPNNLYQVLAHTKFLEVLHEAMLYFLQHGNSLI